MERRVPMAHPLPGRFQRHVTRPWHRQTVPSATARMRLRLVLHVSQYATAVTRCRVPARALTARLPPQRVTQIHALWSPLRRTVPSATADSLLRLVLHVSQHVTVVTRCQVPARALPARSLSRHAMLHVTRPWHRQTVPSATARVRLRLVLRVSQHATAVTRCRVSARALTARLPPRHARRFRGVMPNGLASPLRLTSLDTPSAHSGGK